VKVFEKGISVHAEMFLCEYTRNINAVNLPPVVTNVLTLAVYIKLLIFKDILGFKNLSHNEETFTFLFCPVTHPANPGAGNLSG
jgi:hypothetical protein